MSVRSRCMGPSLAGRVAIWTSAISVSAIDPHAIPFAFGAAIAKEAFDLLRACLQRVSVLAYLRAARGATYLSIGRSAAAPALVLRTGSRSVMRSDDKDGADPLHAGDEYLDAGPDLAVEEFCIKQRRDWLAYAMARTRNWPDAEDAVSHAVLKILEHHAMHGTLCPKGRDPVAWSKTVIHNYIIDRDRRRAAEDKRSTVLVPHERDLAEDVADQIIVKKALAFVASLDPKDHQIAVMRWIDGLEPQDIAKQLGMNPHSVRTSLHRTKKKIRTVLGVAEPRKVLREKTT
jgi:RNA polymerase sigma factor (sigma-70 family)